LSHFEIKKMRLAGSLFGLCLVGLLLTGCATSQPQAMAPKCFHESATTDLVLRFNRWDTIHMLRPELREGPYLKILTRADIEGELKTHRSGRNLAVVVIGLLTTWANEAELARDWDALLLGNGFRRVVLLRARGSQDKEIDGLAIVHDSGVAGGPGQPTATAVQAGHPQGQ
jgi:hypothetical protein